MSKKDVKDFFKKFWFIVWKDDSPKGWLISVVFIFVAIKFIFFPLLSLATGTALPLAIVESCSMHHQGDIFSDYNIWWDKHESKYSPYTINKLDFQEFPMKKGFTKGDILFITRANPEKLKVGDIIIFEGGRENPIIHRIIKIEEKDGKRIFSTMGDNNNGQLEFEKAISQEQIVGKASLRLVPYLGWVKLIFFETTRPTSERGLCVER